MVQRGLELPILGEVRSEKLIEEYANHGRLLTWEACPNCSKKRWVRKNITGCLCADCNRIDPIKRQKISQTLTGCKRDWSPSKEHRERIRQAILGKKCTSEHIEKVRQASLTQWRNPETRDRLVKALLEIRSPNKQEMLVLDMLNRYCGNEWKFVGDGSLIIGGLSPDYVNTNGKKMIVEYMGEYWHRPQDGKYKAKIYAQLGFKTLVIWSRELKDKDKLIEHIQTWWRNG